MLNYFKYYKRCIHVLYHILEFVQEKKTKFTMGQLDMLPILYHSCWCPGDLRSHGISRHNINQVIRNIPSLPSEQLNPRCHWSIREGYMMTSSNENIPCYWPFVRGIHRSPVESPHKGQWRGDLMFSLICGWTNGWAYNGDASELRRHRAHYDVIVMMCKIARYQTKKTIKTMSWFLECTEHLFHH